MGQFLSPYTIMPIESASLSVSRCLIDYSFIDMFYFTCQHPEKKPHVPLVLFMNLYLRIASNCNIPFFLDQNVFIFWILPHLLYIIAQDSYAQKFCENFVTIGCVIPTWTWVNESYIPKVFITFFSRTARHKKLKQNKVTNMKNKYNVLCILKSGCSYFFIPLFLPFSVSPIFNLY